MPNDPRLVPGCQIQVTARVIVPYDENQLTEQPTLCAVPGDLATLISRPTNVLMAQVNKAGHYFYIGEDQYVFHHAPPTAPEVPTPPTGSVSPYDPTGPYAAL